MAGPEIEALIQQIARLLGVGARAKARIRKNAGPPLRGKDHGRS